MRSYSNDFIVWVFFFSSLQIQNKEELIWKKKKKPWDTLGSKGKLKFKEEKRKKETCKCWEKINKKGENHWLSSKLEVMISILFF